MSTAIVIARSAATKQSQDAGSIKEVLRLLRTSEEVLAMTHEGMSTAIVIARSPSKKDSKKDDEAISGGG